MGELLVLCYHAIDDAWNHDMSIRPADLRVHLGMLRRRGYLPSTFSEAVLAPRHERTVAVTFDDAFASVYTEAFPILRDLGFFGTLFVPTAFPGPGNALSWPGFDPGPCRLGQLRPATWSQIAEMADAGWEIGSHSRTHPRLGQLDDATLRAEIFDSKSECEDHVQRPCRSLAYPFGQFDRRVLDVVAEAGYVTAASLDRRTRPHNLAIARIGVYRRDRRVRFVAKTSRISRTGVGAQLIDTRRISASRVAASVARLRRTGGRRRADD